MQVLHSSKQTQQNLWHVRPARVFRVLEERKVCHILIYYIVYISFFVTI